MPVDAAHATHRLASSPSPSRLLCGTFLIATTTHRVNVVYPTRLFADYSRGGELLKPIFESHAARDVVLSFRGSIMKKDMGPFKVFRHLVCLAAA